MSNKKAHKSELWPIKNAYNLGFRIEAKFKEYSDPFSVELINLFDGKPDCKVGHFGYNFYFRTPYGIKAKRYKSKSTLQGAIARTAKKYGLTLQYLIIN